jgi:phage tail tube protein FII
MWEVGGGASGMITDVSETLGLDKVESEVVVGACGAVNRGGVRKNGSNE